MYAAVRSWQVFATCQLQEMYSWLRLVLRIALGSFGESKDLYALNSMFLGFLVLHKIDAAR